MWFWQRNLLSINSSPDPPKTYSMMSSILVIPIPIISHICLHGARSYFEVLVGSNSLSSELKRKRANTLTRPSVTSELSSSPKEFAYQ